MEVDVQHFKIHLDPLGGDECFKIELCEEEDKGSEVSYPSIGEEIVYVINDKCNIVPQSKSDYVSSASSKSFVINYPLNNNRQGKSVNRHPVLVSELKQEILDIPTTQQTTAHHLKLDDVISAVSESVVTSKGNRCYNDDSDSDCIISEITIKRETEGPAVKQELIVDPPDSCNDVTSAVSESVVTSKGNRCYNDDSDSDCILSEITIKQETEGPAVKQELIVDRLDSCNDAPPDISESLITDCCLEGTDSIDFNHPVAKLNQPTEPVLKHEPKRKRPEPYRLKCHSYKPETQRNSYKVVVARRKVPYTGLLFQTGDYDAEKSQEILSSAGICHVKQISKPVPTQFSGAGQNTACDDTVSCSSLGWQRCYACQFCGQAFRLRYVMKEHVKLVHPRQKFFACDQCSFTTSGISYLRKHMKVHKVSVPSQPHACSVCGKVFKVKCRLDSHMNIHREEYLFSCHLCEYRAKSKRNLIRHLETHDDTKTYRCHVCDYEVKYKRTLRTHMRLRHEVYTCSFETFDKKRSDEHYESSRHKTCVSEEVVNVDNETNYQCSECDYRALTRGRVQSHRYAKHGCGTVYVCEHCDFTTNYSSNFHQHKVVHATIGKFQCDVCGTKFKRVHGLRQHYLTVHERVRPFSCTKCDYTAAFKIDLKRHVQAVHDCIKPFVCSLCGYSATQRNLLVRHIDSQHYNLKPYNCNYCKVYGTTSKQILIKHIKSRHYKQICPSSEPS